MRHAPEHEARFKSWLEEYRGIIFKVTRAYAQNPADWADLRQELLLQLWISAPAFNGQAKASTWVYRVCLNTAMAWRRGANRREQRIEAARDVSEIAAGTASPAEDISERDLLEKLYATIHALPDFDRALILLQLDGLAYREMAEIAGLTENHVGVALTRARQRLAETMKGVTDELA